MYSKSCRMLAGIFCLVASPIVSPKVLEDSLVQVLGSTGSDGYQNDDYLLEVEEHWQSKLKEAEASGNQDQRVALSLSNLAEIYDIQGHHDKAESFKQRTLAIWEQALAVHPLDLATSLNNLAVTHRNKHQYPAAKLLYQRAMAIRREAVGPEHPATVRIIHNLAALYHDHGQYVEAEPLYLKVLAIREKTLDPEDPATAQTLNDLGALYSDQGEYTGAESLFRRALTIWEETLDPNHLDVAMGLNNLAMLYYEQYQFAEAEPLYQRALAIREQTLGLEHPDVARTLDDMAGFYQDQGRYTEAEPLYQRALAIRETNLDPHHLDLAQSLSNLAGNYEAQDQYGKALPFRRRAEEILEKAAEIFERSNGMPFLSNNKFANQSNNLDIQPKPRYQRSPALREQVSNLKRPNATQSRYDPAASYDKQDQYTEADLLYQQVSKIWGNTPKSNRLDAVNGLNDRAMSHQDKGQYANAEPLYKRALAIRERTLQSEHPAIALSLNNLAALYVDQGQYSAAEPLYLRALELREKVLGEEHPDVAVSLNNLAGLKVQQSRYRQAEPLYQRALAIREKLLGFEHPDVARTVNDLAALYVDQGQYGKAESLFQRALAIREHALGHQHPAIAESLNSLAVLLHHQGQDAEAKPLYQRALIIRENALDPNHPDLAQSLNNLAVLHHDLGRDDKAESLHLHALAIWEQALGSEHPNLAISLNNLARLYHDQDNYTKAQPLYQRALAIREKALGSEHPDVALVRQGLATLYQDQGQYTKAESLHQQALVVWEKVLGSRHPDVALSLNNLAELYRTQGQYAKALTYSNRAIAIYRDRLIPLTEDLSEGSLHERTSKRFLFLSHVGLIARVVEKQPKRHRALISAAFKSGQLAHAAGAAQAIAQMAVRSAAGDPVLSRLIHAHQDAISQWRILNIARLKRLQSSNQDHNRSDDTSIALHGQLTLLKNRIGTLKTQLHQQFPAYSELNDPQPVSLAETQQVLGSDEALLVYMVGKTESFLWVVKKDGAAMHCLDINTESSTQAVTKLRGALEIQVSQSRDDLRPFNLRLAHRLYEQVIAPAEPSLKGIRHLFVMADGALQSLPLAALITERPRTTFVFPEKYAQLPWLGEQYAFTTLPAVNSLRVLRRLAKPILARKPFIGFGAPALQGKPGIPSQLAYASTFRGKIAEVGRLRQMSPLPETAGELKEMARYLKAKEDALYLGKRATESRLKSLDLSSARIIAFSTHGLLARETKSFLDPAEAALVLTPPQEATEQDDGLLTVSEITQLKLDADWVILSACNTAAPAAQKADGMGDNDGLSGIAKAFFYAGARSLLVSHWNVESSATSKLMIGLFKQLANNPNMRRAEALQKSMLNLVADKENPHYAHPLFWAPFVVVGEGGAIAGNQADQ